MAGANTGGATGFEAASTGDAPCLGYTALDVAKWFVNATDREAGDAITHLKAQKLVYYAQGWALAHLGRPLFAEDLQAWAHGPVAPSVFEHFRPHGYDALPSQRITRRIVGDAAALLQGVHARYGIYSAKRLEAMTHEEAPWRDARGGLAPDARSAAIIPKSAMRAWFEALRVAA
ncbi:Panacea domain-containing protein [Salinarimonas ramus]|uniref:Antitoxin SocA-like Panacea domain-containing protein n=1 Tax=Salinarimonas ramus TaxID=690164 RepID=A0A917V352_9HYPH|nr:type II toxin-antitoxin system antitoxin SocA domain-containing protein [Salinarimonas ramus]GGK28991.1 hypothetical protein GCM10011322_14260 [Salinarimonas ramus]